MTSACRASPGRRSRGTHVLSQAQPSSGRCVHPGQRGRISCRLPRHQRGGAPPSRPSSRWRGPSRPSRTLVDQAVAHRRPRQAEVLPHLFGDLGAGGVEDGLLLLADVVVQRLGELLDGVVELLGVGALALEQREQRLVALGVLLLAVLLLVLGDRVLALQLGVDLGLLGLAVRDQGVGERLAGGRPVRGGVAQLAQQVSKGGGPR